MLAARSRCSLQVAVAPLFEETIAFSVYSVVTGLPTKTLLASGSVLGIRPSLVIADACSLGMSRRRLWRALRLTALNAALGSSTPSSDPFELELAPALVGAPDTEIQLSLHNDGLCETVWAVLFPNDLSYQPEPWAQVFFRFWGTHEHV